ncbi:MAG TPA: glycerophosphoryl diester phosphodiesterase membrane domain-containing protein [Acidimicrobiales bacterium]|nr:glycerophosphoryl diester phosphodiesterase membrane domain-containing protein [Acidimicrobiales bacterium]
MDPSGLRPLGVGEILDLAIKIYRARFADLVKVVAVAVAPIFLLGALVQLSASSDDLGRAPGEATSLDFNEIWTFVAGVFLVAVLGFIASQLASAASFRIVSGTYLDERPTWRESLSFATSKLRSLVWLSIVLGFFLVLSFLALIVPGFYFAVAWTVATPVLLFEGLRGSSALRRSRQLVRGRWWPTLAVVFLSTLFTSIVQGLIGGVLFAAVRDGGSDAAVALANAVTNITASAITTPFTAAVIAVVYFDLRVRKEGFDLELLTRRVGVDPGEAPPPADA